MTSDETEPHTTDLKRSDTQEIDNILTEDNTIATTTAQPECLMFPTYACEVDVHGATDSKGDELEWKVNLAGWVYAKPTSTRLERALLGESKKKKN